MEEVFVPAIGVAGGIAAFGWGFMVWRRMRLIVDTPTAKVRSMPMGRVELHGCAQEKAELAAPITKQPCVYYRYTVEEERRSGKNKTWVTVDRGDSAAWAFYLEDETGAVLLMPEGAKVEIGCDFEAKHGGLSGLISGRDKSFDPTPWVKRGWLGLATKKLRFREWRIHAGEPLYVLGVSQERVGIAGRIWIAMETARSQARSGRSRASSPCKKSSVKGSTIASWSPPTPTARRLFLSRTLVRPHLLRVTGGRPHWVFLGARRSASCPSGFC
jgi:hypothetical protein